MLRGAVHRRGRTQAGCDVSAAQSLAEFYWRVVYPDMPDEYRTPDCGDGAKLDLHKNSDVWP